MLIRNAQPLRMMDNFTLSLLGSFALWRNREPVTAFESNKGRALLIYLAVEQGNHTRPALAKLLWPEHNADNARMNLRQTLYQLRRILGDETVDPPWLLVDRRTIGLNPAAAWHIDVVAFRTLIAATATHSHQSLATCEACLEQLHRAVEHYRSDFLTGFALDDSAPFEEWRRITQEQLFFQAFDALRQLTTAAVARRDHAAVLRYAQRQLALEPWHEEAHRQLMAAYWWRGQRNVALAQYESCRQILADELAAVPDKQTIALYEQIRAGAAPAADDSAPALLDSTPLYTSKSSFAVVATGTWSPWRDRRPQSPALGAGWSEDRSDEDNGTSAALPALQENTQAAAAANHLPTPLTPFVGRTAELAALLAQLQRPTARLISLLGPGGIGKTRLAQQVGARYRATANTNVFFVGLAGLTDPAGLAAVMATALGLNQPSVEPQHALVQWLRDQQTLLILDNFEHLLRGTALLVDLLQAASGLQLLVTSRARLNIPGEQFFVLEGMRYPLLPVDAAAAPAPTASDDLVTLAQENSAIALFCQCAQRVAPHFQLTVDTLPAVIHICQRVQGVPLALEMAAAWLEVLPLPAIATEIAQSTDFLTSHWRGLPSRQQSMRAVFHWSWQLLNQTEQQALRRLAIFQGGFTRAAADAVAGVTLRTLAALIHKSLLQFAPQENEGGRYQLHELLRQFATEALDHAGETLAMGEAHSDYYLRLVVESAQQFATAASGAAVTRLQTELDNIEQAWRWAADHGRHAALAQSAYALGEFYLIAGLTAQGVQSFRYAQRALPTQHAAEPPGSTSPVAAMLRSTLPTLEAQFLVYQGLYDQAFVLIEALLPVSRATGNYWAESLGLVLRAIITIRRGDYKGGQMALAATLTLVRSYQQQAPTTPPLIETELTAILWLAHQALLQSQHAEAYARFHEGLALAQRWGRRRSELSFLLNLASLASTRRDLTTAQQLFTTALPIARAFGYRWGEASAQLELGDAILLDGAYEEAAARCQAALAIFQQINDPLKAAYSLLTLARAYSYLGDDDAAQQYFDRLRPYMNRGESAAVQPYVWLGLAGADWLQGRYAAGVKAATQGLQVVSAAQTPLARAHYLVLLAHNQLGLAQDADAALHYQEALHYYTTHHLPMLAVEAAAGLAQIALRQGALVAALNHVETILQTMQQEVRVGYDEPFRAYVACYQVLAAAGDTRATTVLAQGRRVLQHYADRIQNSRHRRLFLHNVSIHRTLCEAAMHH